MVKFPGLRVCEPASEETAATAASRGAANYDWWQCNAGSGCLCRRLSIRAGLMACGRLNGGRGPLVASAGEMPELVEGALRQALGLSQVAIASREGSEGSE